MRPSFKEEKKLWDNGHLRVACFDEAGRGPLAGPVVAAAVISNPSIAVLRSGKLGAIKDSKQLSPRQREELYRFITRHPQISWGIGSVSEKIIDKINILEATKLAMRKALKNLRAKIGMPIDYLIVDGNFRIPGLVVPQEPIIGADNTVFSCAAASIIAKVTRDRIMARMHKKYPQYGFNINKGYPTLSHRKMLKLHGVSKVHRKTFGPVRSLLKS